MNESISSIDALLNQAKDDREKVDLLNDFAWELKDNHPQQSIEVSQRALAIAEKNFYQRGIAQSLYHRGVCKYLMSDYEDALAELLHVLTLFEKIGDRAVEGRILNWIGNIHYRLGDYPAALNYYLKSLKIKEEIDDKIGQAFSHNDIGSVYERLGDTGKAIAYYTKSLALKEELGHIQGQAYSLNELGGAYERIGDDKRALYYYNKALELREQIHDKRGQGVSLSNIGSLYQRSNNFEQAEKHYLRSLDISRDVGHKYGEASTLVRLGTLLLHNGDHAKAFEYLMPALSIAEEIKSKEWIYKAHAALSEAYEQQGDLQNALIHFKAYHRLKEEVFSREVSQKMKGLTIQYEVEKSQREAEIYRLKNVELARVNKELQDLTVSLQEANKHKSDLLAQVQHQAKELERQAREDSLTGLFNRRYLDAQLAREFERADRYKRPFSLAISDIDFFKMVNDRFSHQVGDEVLRRLANIFRMSSRSNDVIGRYGGEEFLLLMPETNLSQAIAACEKIRQAVEHYEWETVHPQLKVTISMGISDMTHLDSVEKILADADAKLYVAKSNGRNQVRY